MSNKQEIFKEILESKQSELIKSLKGAIRFPSVSEFSEGEYPFGKNVHKCLEFMLELAASMGFKTCSVDNHVGWCEYGEGEEMVAVLGHLDVVPPGDGWSVPPYEGRIIDGKIYGRGAMDDKGPTVAALYALLALKESAVKLNKRIRLFFGLSEENGGNDIRYYLENGGEIPVMGFTPDGEYPVIHGEKGFIIEHYKYIFGDNSIDSEVITNYDNYFDDFGNESLSPKWRVKLIKGGTAENIVPHSAEVVLVRTVKDEWAEEREEEFTYPVNGVSAHAASPWEGENAIQKLLSKMTELPLENEIKAVVQFLHEKFKMEHDGTSLGIAMSDEESGPLTMNLGMIHGDEKSIEIGLNYRYPVTKSFEECEPVVRKQFEDAGFILTDQEHDECLYMPTDSELVNRLMYVYKDFTGRDDAPKCIGGATYAKALPNVLAFGPLFPGDENREHRPDEYVEIDWLMKNALLITEAMYALAVD